MNSNFTFAFSLTHPLPSCTTFCNIYSLNKDFGTFYPATDFQKLFSKKHYNNNNFKNTHHSHPSMLMTRKSMPKGEIFCNKNIYYRVDKTRTSYLSPLTLTRSSSRSYFQRLSSLNTDHILFSILVLEVDDHPFPFMMQLVHFD